MEGTPITNFALYPNLAMHHLDQMPAYGEPETGAAEFSCCRGVRLRKRLEEIGNLVFRHANALVTDREVQFHFFCLDFLSSDLNDHIAAGRELQRI